MNSIYKYIGPLMMLAGVVIIAISLVALLNRVEPQPYTTTSDVEARAFIARCDSGVLIQEKDGIFTMECGK